MLIGTSDVGPQAGPHLVWPSCQSALPRNVAPCELEPPENELCGAFASAPKRTRTSTRLSRTRPSTWRVYQFRHRREGDGEYSPAVLAFESVQRGRYIYEHMFAPLDQPAVTAI